MSVWQSVKEWLLATPQPASSGEKAFNISGFQNYTQVQHLLVHGPGASEAYTSSGDGNSAVFACLMALGSAYIEPPVRVWREDASGKREPDPNHQCQLLLDDPHPELTAKELWFWTSWARHCDG